MPQNYSYLFVVAMGMGVTFIGLTTIIALTQLMGIVITKLDKRKPQPTAENANSKSVVSVPSVPDDGISDYVKVAIISALAQEPGFKMDRVTRIEIKKHN